MVPFRFWPSISTRIWRMRRAGGFVASVTLAGVLMGATRTLPTGDAERGRELFRTNSCVQCHSVNRRGGNTAPDLASSVVRGFSPYQLAAALWNHVPGMSNAWRRKSLSWPELSEQDAADLFLYLYASRYFEAPGDAGRGRSVFRSKRCGSCHGLTSPIGDGIQPVAAWESLEDAIALAQGMLNHRVQMRSALVQSGTAYPTLSPQELTDLLVYLRSQVRRSGRPAEFSPDSPDRGREVLASKGCLVCHRGSRSLAERPTRHTLTDLVSALWNHPLPVSPAPALMSYEEMRDLAGYLLSTQFSSERGDSEQGRRVYGRKGCGACHDDPASGAPPRAGLAGRMNSLAMMEAGWKHAPGMLGRMRARKLKWPRIDSLEMADLIAYLHGNQLRRRP